MAPSLYMLSHNRDRIDVNRPERHDTETYLDSLRCLGILTEEDFTEAAQSWNVFWLRTALCPLSSSVCRVSLYQKIRHWDLRDEYSLDLSRQLQLWALQDMVYQARHGRELFVVEPYVNIFPMFGGIAELTLFSESSPFGQVGSISFSPWDYRWVTPRSKLFIPHW